MLIVELLPLNKGNAFSFHCTDSITLGRTPTIGCLDNKISRNHALLFLKPDGTVWIKPLHHNPTFYKTKTDQIVSLTRNKEYQLHHNDQFGLLPDEYFYRVSVKSEDEHPKSTSAIPKSPVKDNDILTVENLEDEKPPPVDNIASQTTRTLPDWISNDPEPTSTSTNTLNEENPTTTAPIRRRIRPEERSTKRIVYDDSDDNESLTEPAAAPSTSNQDAATTSTNPRKRERCPYGESCYRKNLVHQQEVSHPGDPDWDIKAKETVKSKPDCPYGNECYRKNADHWNEYNHPKKKCIELPTKSRTTKRRAADDDDDDDDDDGLPNEYDYNDSFIDDENFDSDTTNDEQASVQSDGDEEWKPEKFSRPLDDTDDYSSDESDRELRNREADRFLKRRTSSDDDMTKKKPRTDDD